MSLLLSDLAFSDYHLLPNIKKWTARKILKKKEDLIAETNTYFAELDQLYYSLDQEAEAVLDEGISL